MEEKVKPGTLDISNFNSAFISRGKVIPAPDCSDWKRSCLDVVKRLNRAWFDPKRSKKTPPATIKVPRTELLTDLLIYARGARVDVFV